MAKATAPSRRSLPPFVTGSVSSSTSSTTTSTRSARGADATAVAYVETIAGDTTTRWGIGTDPNIITASLRAVLSATSRLLDDGKPPSP